MKIAKTVDGHLIEAAHDAPAHALCPHCGGKLTLRQRKRMGGEVTYFWRHLSNQNRDCSARKSISSIKNRHESENGT